MEPESQPAYLVERLDGVLTFTLNRPEQGNAVPPSAAPGMAALFEDAQQDASIRCILIQGAGKHFTTGGDVAGFARGVAEGPAKLQADFTVRMANVKRLVLALVRFDRPIVAAVKGAVVGAGLFYSLAADIVLGDDTAFFLFGHQRMGLSPDTGVSWLLPRITGVRPAKELLLSAARVEAQDAKALGLLSRIVAPGKLEEAAMELAKRLARAPQYATRMAKRLVNQAGSTSLEDHLDAEGEAIITSVGDPDFAEGVGAFMEKRPARFPSAQ